jgi:Sec-independent protein translocase protein TatA
MAELLIVVVVVVVVLGYAADRARKLRARARQLSGMNDRLDVAAAKVDEEQQRRRARTMASAELTSVMPAIKRPPLTIPGMAGHGDVPEEPEEQAAPGVSPVSGAGSPAQAGSPAEASSSAGAGSPVQAGSPAEASSSAAAGSPAEARSPAEAGTAAQESGIAGGDAPDAEPGASSASPVPAAEVPAQPASRLADDTLNMPAGMTADDLPAVPKIQVTTDGTLIMRPVPDQGPAPAGEELPGQDGMRDEPAASQEHTNRR